MCERVLELLQRQPLAAGRLEDELRAATLPLGQFKPPKSNKTQKQTCAARRAPRAARPARPAPRLA